MGSYLPPRSATALPTIPYYSPQIKTSTINQNLTGRTISILVLSTTSWPRLRLHIAEIRIAIDTTQPGTFLESTIAR